MAPHAPGRLCPVAEALVAWIGVGIVAPLLHRQKCRRRDGALVLAANANLASVGSSWPPAGPGGLLHARCSPAVRALGEKTAGWAVGRGAAGTGVAPQAGRGIPGTASCRGWVGVSLIEPQRRDQDVALPHVTNQIPFATDHRPVRPPLRVMDQRPLEPRSRRSPAISSSPPSDGDDDAETLSGRRLARRPLLGPRWRRAPRTRLPRWRHKRRRRRLRRRPPCAPRDARLA